MPPTEEERLSPAVKGLALVSLGNDFASEMIYPLLPAFVTSLGGGSMTLGALDGAADLTASVLRWWSGPRADRPGWRPGLIAAGYGLAILVRPLVAFAAAGWQVIAVRVVDRIGKGLRSPARDAMIADLTPAGSRGRAFGLQRGADHLGAVFGSLAAFGLLAHGVGVRHVLAASVIPGLLVLVVLAVVLARSRARRAAPAPPAADEPPGRRVDPRLVALAGFAAARLPETLLLLRLGDLGITTVAVPLLWAGLHVVRSAASYPAGWVADHLGARGAMGLGTAAYIATIGALAAPLGPGLAITIFLLFGVAAGVLEPVERAAVALVRTGTRGRLFGSYQGLGGILGLVLGIGYGWIYQRLGPPVALGGAAGLTLGALVAWLVLDRRRGILAGAPGRR
jgi:MFS family permease